MYLAAAAAIISCASPSQEPRTMPGDSATLPDVLAKVPGLLSSCMCGLGESAEAIRTVCLVSKELSYTAMHEVTYCDVELGEGACPDPGQVIRLMQHTKLKHLSITINTTSARAGPSLAQQLATCTSQLEQLLQAMGTAIKGVYDMDIIFAHDLVRSRRRSRGHYDTRKAPRNCPASFAVIGRTICPMLAAAMPGLIYLCVRGCCRDPAFGSFGTSSPLLTHLTVEAITLPIKALKDIEQHLPLLNSFTLTYPLKCPNDSQLSNYVGSSLQALQASTSLTKMTLDFGDRVWVRCKPGGWSHVPPNLREFISNGGITSLENATKRLSNLYTLYIGQDQCMNLRILGQAPLLRQYTIHSEHKAVMLTCYDADVAQNVSLLRERVRGGLRLDVPLLGLQGGNEEQVLAVLAVFPRVKSVRKLKLALWSAVTPVTLAHVARAFPKLEELLIEGPSYGLPAQIPAAQLLGHLVLCTSLTKLRLLWLPGLTAAVLAQLCLSLPRLKVLGCSQDDGVDMSELLTTLNAQGNVMLVHEKAGVYHQHDFLL